jgi:osmotically-inducible protein OsmY
MTNKTLQHLVEAELEWDPRIESTAIGVSASDGVITLSGAVTTYLEKVNAGRAALCVKGVQGVAQEIEVRSSGNIGNDDDEVAKRAITSLEWNSMIPLHQIQVKVDAGFVTLSGEVEWDFEREAAEHTVQKLHGVLAVNNAVTLKARVQPADIHHRIQEALERQGQLRSEDIRVSVDGRKVRLEGTVDAWNDRFLIEQAAWAAPGVYAVEDRVTVAA